jgi:hypothetical protein
MRLFDISNPTAPREIDSYKTPGYTDHIWVSQDTAYVANYDAGLMILGLEPGKQSVVSSSAQGGDE